MRPVVWMADDTSAQLREHLARSKPLTVSSYDDFARATRQPETVAFVDDSTLATLGRDTPRPAGTVIAMCAGTRQDAVRQLNAHVWLDHIIATGTLRLPIATVHLERVMATATTATPRLLDWTTEGVTGRRVRLAQASKRVDRLERMGQFFETNGVAARSLEFLREVAEELLTNAFYDAPVAAGVVNHAIPRTQDVVLPEDEACDLVYGCTADSAFVRVKDPFGALARTRLVEVLMRCAQPNGTVDVDETFGGAGLGLWRIFAVASYVAIAVVANRSTEFLVGIARKTQAGARPFALHMFARAGARRGFWQLFGGDSSATAGKSVTLIRK